MKNTGAYSEIKSWFEGNRDFKTGLKLHTRYSKNSKNINKLAVTVINRKQLLETYLQEILNNCKPASEPKFTNKKQTEAEVKKVFHQSFQERLEKEFPKIKFSELPDTLKLLVFKRFEAWEKSKEFHALQHTAQSDDERLEAAKLTVRAIMENWGIWVELDHYHKTGKILGQHPDFQKDEFETWLKEQEKKSAQDCFKEFNTLRKNARYNIGRFVKIQATKELTEQQKQKLEIWIYKHDIVSAKLQEPLWNDEL